MKWFRWYRCSTENPKFAIVAARANKPGMGVCLTDVIAVWATILEDAANPEHWGYLKKDANFIAVVLRWGQEEVQQIIDSMIEEGLLDAGGHVAKWEEYQYSSDSDPTNAERQRRYYNKHKHAANPSITVRKRKPNALAKRPDTDTDTDTDKKDIRASESFEEFCKAYPKRDGANPKAPARLKFLSIVKSGVDPAAIIAGARGYAAAEFKNVGTPYIAMMTAFLNQRRWEDYSGASAATVVDETEFARLKAEYDAKIARSA